MKGCLLARSLRLGNRGSLHSLLATLLIATRTTGSLSTGSPLLIATSLSATCSWNSFLSYVCTEPLTWPLKGPENTRVQTFVTEARTTRQDNIFHWEACQPSPYKNAQHAGVANVHGAGMTHHRYALLNDNVCCIAFSLPGQFWPTGSLRIL